MSDHPVKTTNDVWNEIIEIARKTCLISGTRLCRCEAAGLIFDVLTRLRWIAQTKGDPKTSDFLSPLLNSVNSGFYEDKTEDGTIPHGFAIYNRMTHVAVPREPTEAQKRAAFGPIMCGGRDGPIHPDFIRQEAALVTYRAMIAAAQETPGEKDSSNAG